MQASGKDKIHVLLRNDDRQILFVEQADGNLTVPWGLRGEGVSHPQAIRTLLREATGLDASGLYPLTTMAPLGEYYFSGFVSGGKLKEFPTNHIQSVSWIAPSTALRLLGLQPLLLTALNYLIRHDI